MAALPQEPPPTTGMPQNQNPPTPLLRVDTPESNPESAPAPPPRLKPQAKILFQSGQAPIRPPQGTPHIAPDDTEPMPSAAHQNTNGGPTVP